MKKAADKITEIRRFLEELEGIVPEDFNSYRNSIEKKAACERYVEKIVESVTDLAFMVIKDKKLRIPEDDVDAFNILLDSDIIAKELASKLKCAKGMRNIISHQYGAVDDKIVFESIKEELDKDVNEFIKVVKKVLS